MNAIADLAGGSPKQAVIAGIVTGQIIGQGRWFVGHHANGDGTVGQKSIPGHHVGTAIAKQAIAGFLAIHAQG